ncbi:MAG: DUF3634 family protein [Myxococcales bacterium]|nr:DUF3634 family protein [Myxococcales bacterium]
MSWILLAIGVVALLFGLGLRRANELFCVKVRDGKPRLARGKAPPRLYADLEDVLTRARVRQAEVRVVVEDRRPRVLSSGVGQGTEQQLRNVVGTWQLAQIRAAR